MNKETLEEAAENHLQKWRLLNNIHLSNILHAERCKNDFIAGAKWQQNIDDKKYTEEDVLFAFVHGGTKFEENKDANKLSENFKELISLLNKIK
jgi:hypothetical protein